MDYTDAGKKVIYRSRSIRTVQQALRMLYSIPQPILCYRQTIHINAPEIDHVYAGCIHNDVENHLLTISFPSELYGYITRIRNSRDCRMVTYWKHPITEFIQEVEITSTTELSLFHRHATHEPSLRIYTQGYTDLIVTYDVYLFKPTFFQSSQKLLAKL